MKSVKVFFAMTKSVKEFVDIVNKYPYDVDLKSGRYVVDAKSLLGIYSLDLSIPIIMEIHNDDCMRLLSEISSFLVK